MKIKPLSMNVLTYMAVLFVRQFSQFTHFILSVGLVLYFGLMLPSSARAGLAKQLNVTSFYKQQLQQRPSTIIIVDTTADEDGTNPAKCSLREAVKAATTNSAYGGCPAGTPGLDTIEFNLGTGTPAIFLTGSTLLVDDPLIINGKSGGATRVRIDGGFREGVDGFSLRRPGCIVRSMVITRFGVGLSLEGGTVGGHIVEDCYIGTDGTTDLGNRQIGIHVVASGCQIGGTLPSQRNIISGSRFQPPGVGIEIDPSNTPGINNLIQGNYIGTDASGTVAIPNTVGIRLIALARNNTVGGTDPAARNLISGNQEQGVFIIDNSNGNNLIQGNYIGTDISGMLDLGNGTNGIEIWNSSNNIFGGTNTGARNVISGNNENGFRLLNVCLNNTIQGNYIGTGADGITPLGNGQDGIMMLGQVRNTLIGGDTQAAGNRIANNVRNGIFMLSYQGLDPSPFTEPLWPKFNLIKYNEIYSNGALGIDLTNGVTSTPPNGTTANDLGDVDRGANELQNYPILTSANTGTSSTTILGSLNSISNLPYTIQFFSNPGCGGASHGEGRTVLGQTTVNTDANGNASFNVTLPIRVVNGSYISSTAIDPGNNTSEFSPCQQVVGPPTLDIDGDGIPDLVEIAEGRNPLIKDNDIFSNNAMGHRLFVMQQYRDFLGREGDAAGIQGWVNLLANGASTRTQVIQSFFNSTEFQQFGAPIVRLYLAYFQRIPDYAGQIAWTNVLRGGTALETISQSFATSPEFIQTYGNLNNTQFVTLVYQNVLNRTPSQAEINAWVALLNQGASRGQVMTGFSESAEFKLQSANKVFVVMMYVGMLRRAPEQAGFDGWVALLNSGTSQLVLTQAFLDAPEYRNRFLP